ncbi:MAG TPA: hypothetical protein DDZ80_01385 [Cyanobacteria bacterium UBA8803]|nr:hypothetical protein [Cyanobacteria bacterium UBA9273]HBL57256.1 hypothetical protein [Cyanobacteria bacterium UBA8803]
MISHLTHTPKTTRIPQAPRKFYFLEYFYILLKGVSTSNQAEKIFDYFLELKHQYRLGESKYKKLTEDSHESTNQMARYRYTFDQVVSEATDYKLISINNGEIELTSEGRDALQIYETKGTIEFNHYLFQLMEEKHHEPFRYLIETCYKVNAKKSGLLIFPIYSAYRLGIERDSLKASKDIKKYFQTLQNRIEEDISKHLGKNISLKKENNDLIQKIAEEGLLPTSDSQAFDPKKYNTILRRSRDFWLKYFLQTLYEYQISLDSFEIWAYRAKQIGLLHITEFYPDPSFYGKVVYPLSVIKTVSKSESFQMFYEYRDASKLYLHQPSWKNENTQEEFVQSLHQAYLDVRQLAKTYFVSLPNVKERVCYAMKIPEYLFDQFLSQAYNNKRLRISISLEVDKLPDETKVMYLRREPVMVDGKYRNIIAIDLA